MSDNFVLIEQLAPKSNIYIDKEGLWITTELEFDENNLQFSDNELKRSTEFAKTLNSLLPILVEQEIAEIVDRKLLINFENVYYLYDSEYGLINYLPPLSPFIIEIESHSWFGNENFRYTCKFLFGDTEVFVEQYGCFVKKAGSIYHLNKHFYELLTKIDQFNNLPASSKDITNTLLAFGEIKSLSKAVEAQLDTFLNSNDVITPEKVELGFEQDQSGRITVYPVLKDVSEEDLCRVYKGFTEAQSIYDLNVGDNQGRIRVVLSPDVKEVIEKIRPLSHIGGKEKAKIITNPREVISGITNPDILDLSNYGPRVKGIGPYVFQPKPFIKTSAGFLEHPDDDIDIFKLDSNGKKIYEAGIETIDVDDDKVIFDIPDEQTLEEIIDKIEKANVEGSGVINLIDKEGKERIIPVNKDITEGVKYFSKKHRKKQDSKGRPSTDDGKCYVLIYENEEESDYVESTDGAPENFLKDLIFYKPKSLNTNIELKKFQEYGVAWLQSAYKDFKRRGVLLADEMGLGKTLQVLSFLAWYIENNFQDVPPYEPILIVAPLILVANWEQEIKKFFKADGDIFVPHIALHGDNLKYFKKPCYENGRECDLGKEVLDIEKFKGYRLIVTNYDTVKNYQHSFAQVNWSIIVTDESQEIKEPKTAVSYAIKSLQPKFRIAMTGTPVENRLLDLWNILDFIQPGLLGSAKEFRDQYEANIHELNETERQSRANILKNKLKHNKTDAYLIHRKKKDNLSELPDKIIVPIECKLDQDIEDLHLEILNSVRSDSGRKGRHMEAVQRLSRIYQHIDLVQEGFEVKTPKYYIDKSQKLEEVRKILYEIRNKQEKVLIFTVSVRMQHILKSVFENEFKLDIDIVNGAVNRKTTQRGESTRLNLIKKFESHPGFNILILSPDVAGVGLNIIGANHVIHYGRWWNPAKEAQATDRVYRIGQTKDVYVYYPIYVSDRFTSFDLKLHKLLEKKRILADDFLAPTATLDVTQSEIFDELAAESTDNMKPKKYHPISIDLIRTINPYEFEALTAALYHKEGYKVFLTPKSQDCGVDVVAIKDKKILLIQCKHTINTGNQGLNTIDEILNARNYYSSKIFCSDNYRECYFEPICITNSNFARDAQKYSQDCDVKLIQERELKCMLERHLITRSDIYQFEGQRLNSVNELI